MVRNDDMPEDIDETNELDDLEDEDEDDFDEHSGEEEEDEDEQLESEIGINGERLNGTRRHHLDEEAKEVPVRRNYHDIDMSQSED